MKTLYSILLSLLLVAMAAVGVYSLVDVDATTSKTENRKLAEKPAFSIAGLFDGSYISSLEKYYSDTFPGRDALLSANKSLKRLLPLLRRRRQQPPGGGLSRRCGAGRPSSEPRPRHRR